MRLWSLHPKYLDTKGLVALWREALLAKHVLEGKTKGYRNHPQLERFKTTSSPVDAINLYLAEVYKEAAVRKYHFDRSKFIKYRKKLVLPVTDEQLHYEFGHLLSKLRTRDETLFNTLKEKLPLVPHPMFKIVKGPIEKWEVIQPSPPFLKGGLT